MKTLDGIVRDREAPSTRTRTEIFGAMFLTGLLTAGVSFGAYLYGLKTETIPVSDCLMLLAVSTIPLAVLEAVKVLRNRHSKSLSRPLKETNTAACQP